MAEGRPLRWRDSRRVIAADYLAHLPSTAVIVVGLWALGARSAGGFGTVLTVLSIGYLVIAAIEPVFRQATHRYEVSDLSLRHEMGLVERRRRDFPWRSIAAINIDRPWAHRMLGIYRVTLTQAGEESTRVVLRGVARSTVDLVLARVEAELPRRQAEAPSVPTADRVIYAASTGELLLMGVIHGQVLVLAAAGITTTLDLLDGAGLLGPLGGVVQRLPSWVLIPGAFLLACVIGGVATLVRFHGFTVTVDAANQLLIRFGLWESQERRIDPAAVEGVVIQRNIFEQLVGRARIALLTTDSATQLRSNLLLPSLPVPVVRALSQKHFADLVGTDTLLELRPRTTVGLLASLGVLGVAIGAGAGLRQLTAVPLWAALLVALAVVGALWFLGSSASTRFSVDPDRGLALATARFATERQTSLRARAVGEVNSVGLRRAGSRLLWVSLGAYAGRPLRHLALFHPRGPVGDLVGVVLSGRGGDRDRPRSWGSSQ